MGTRAFLSVLLCFGGLQVAAVPSAMAGGKTAGRRTGRVEKTRVSSQKRSTRRGTRSIRGRRVKKVTSLRRRKIQRTRSSGFKPVVAGATNGKVSAETQKAANELAGHWVGEAVKAGKGGKPPVGFSIEVPIQAGHELVGALEAARQLRSRFGIDVAVTTPTEFPVQGDVVKLTVNAHQPANPSRSTQASGAEVVKSRVAQPVAFGATNAEVPADTRRAADRLAGDWLGQVESAAGKNQGKPPVGFSIEVPIQAGHELVGALEAARQIRARYGVDVAVTTPTEFPVQGDVVKLTVK